MPGPGGWGPPPGWGQPAPGWGAAPYPGWGSAPPLPGSGRFRAQGVGEILDSAFTLYRRNVGLILAIAAVVQLPLTLVSFLLYEATGVYTTQARFQQLGGTPGGVTPGDLRSLTSTLAAYLSVVLVVALVQGLVVQPVATAAMTRAVGDVYLERATGLGAAYRAVARRLGAVLLVALILFGAGVGVFAVTAGLTILAVLAFGPAGAAVAILLVPAAIFIAIVVFTRWLFAAPIVMLERASAVTALRRSWALVRGSTARVFGITLLVGLITAILSAVLGALLGIATQATTDVTLHLVVAELVSLVVAILIQPISFIVVVLLYYDLRIRREAFDIEMLAQSL